MKRIIALGLGALLIGGCAMNCSLTEPRYRCNPAGLIEYQKPMDSAWEPLVPAIRCEPGQPITEDNLR